MAQPHVNSHGTGARTDASAPSKLKSVLLRWLPPARIINAVRAALAAMAAWLAGNLLPEEMAQYAYAAALGAFLATGTTLFTIARTALQQAVGLAVGAALGLSMIYLELPGLAKIGIIAAVGVLLQGAPALGTGAGMVPVVAVLVILFGGIDPDGYAVGYVGQFTLGMVVGVLVNAIVMPPLYGRETRQRMLDAVHEMAAVANGTGLTPQLDGLAFPPAGVDDLPHIFRPQSVGGSLDHTGTVEIASSLHRDGSEVERDLRWGVWVTFEAKTDYAVQCFAEYGVKTDETGRYGSLYRPYHMIGLELGVSIASAVLRGEATGAPTGFRGDVVTTAKRDLRAGETLDGEGGYTVFGKLRPASFSLEHEALPLGLAHGAKLIRDVPKDRSVSWSDIDADASLTAVRVRRELEAEFRAEHAVTIA